MVVVFIILQAVDGCSDIADADDGGIVIADDHLVVGVGVGELSVDVDEIFLKIAVEVAGREVEVLIEDGVGDFIDADVLGGEFFGVDLDANREGVAEDDGLGDARDVVKPLSDERIGIIIEFVHGHGGRGDREVGRAWRKG